MMELPALARSVFMTIPTPATVRQQRQLFDTVGPFLRNRFFLVEDSREPLMLAVFEFANERLTLSALLKLHGKAFLGKELHPFSLLDMGQVFPEDKRCLKNALASLTLEEQHRFIFEMKHYQKFNPKEQIFHSERFQLFLKEAVENVGLQQIRLEDCLRNRRESLYVKPTPKKGESSVYRLMVVLLISLAIAGPLALKKFRK